MAVLPVLAPSWAVYQLLVGQLGRSGPTPSTALGGSTLVAATDGNHGRIAVARVPGTPSSCPAGPRPPHRIDAIESEGAPVTVVDGSYDDAVQHVGYARDRRRVGGLRHVVGEDHRRTRPRSSTATRRSSRGRRAAADTPEKSSSCRWAWVLGRSTTRHYAETGSSWWSNRSRLHAVWIGSRPGPAGRGSAPARTRSWPGSTAAVRLDHRVADRRLRRRRVRRRRRTARPKRTRCATWPRSASSPARPERPRSPAYTPSSTRAAPDLMAGTCSSSCTEGATESVAYRRIVGREP